MPPRATPAHATATLDEGVRVVCDGDGGRRGDPIEVYLGDELIGRAELRPARRGGPLSAHIPLHDVPAAPFPQYLRVMNARSGAEIGPGIAIADAAALLAAAGAPGCEAAFAGLHPDGIAFTVTLDRLVRHPRRFGLHRADEPAAIAVSRPHPDTGSPHRISFPLAGPILSGTSFRVTEADFGVTALTGTFDASLLLAATLAQVARLQGELAVLHESHAAMRRRLDAAIDMGRERLLLERLDLFYLLLSERIDQRHDVARPAPAIEPLAVRHFGPAEVDGIGIFDVETDGHHEWRWFGPDATIALRDLDFPVRRAVLYFHGFGDAPEPPLVRVSTGGAGEPAVLRALEGRYAVDVPVARAGAVIDGMLIVHISFDRHQTSAADPRLLSAVFSGAEVIAASG